MQEGDGAEAGLIGVALSRGLSERTLDHPQEDVQDGAGQVCVARQVGACRWTGIAIGAIAR